METRKVVFDTADDWAQWLKDLDCPAKIVVHRVPWLVIHVRAVDHERIAGSIRMMRKQGTLSTVFAVNVVIDLKWWECRFKSQKVVFADSSGKH